MRQITALLAALACTAACTTMTPTELPADAVHEQILSGAILSKGETVKLVTSDGRTHKFRVKAIDTEKQLIVGSKETVAVGDVVALETKNFSVGKTALLAVGTYTTLYIIAAAIVFPAFVL